MGCGIQFWIGSYARCEYRRLVAVGTVDHAIDISTIPDVRGDRGRVHTQCETRSPAGTRRGPQAALGQLGEARRLPEDCRFRIQHGAHPDRLLGIQQFELAVLQRCRTIHGSGYWVGTTDWAEGDHRLAWCARISEWIRQQRTPDTKAPVANRRECAEDAESSRDNSDQVRLFDLRRCDCWH